MSLDDIAQEAVRELVESGRQARFTSRPPQPSRLRTRRIPAWAYVTTGFIVAAVIGGISALLFNQGGSKPPAASTPTISRVDRWGLAGADLPDTADQIATVFEAMPPEIDGIPIEGEPDDHGASYRGEGGRWAYVGYQYGEHRTQPDGSILTPAQWLSAKSADPDAYILGAVLDGPTVWLHGLYVTDDGTEYFLDWGEEGNDNIFGFNASSLDELDALVAEFIAANQAIAPGRPGAAAPTEPTATTVIEVTTIPVMPTTTEVTTGATAPGA